MVITLKRIYITDLETDANGQQILSAPAVVKSITIVSDAAGDATVNFSDSTTNYTIASRCAKIKTTDENQTVSICFGEGLPLTSGLCATSNKASVDVFVVYE
jgi:hypothetical protein